MKKRWVIAAGALSAAAVTFQKIELDRFSVDFERIDSDKIKGHVRFAVLSDLHEKMFGRENVRLIEAVKAQKPDMILIPGDLLTIGKKQERLGEYTRETILRFVLRLCRIAPVTFCPGNHERRLYENSDTGAKSYLEFRDMMLKAGVTFLENDSEVIRVRGNEICFTGLDLDLGFYKKFDRPMMEEGYLDVILPEADPDRFNILLAHHPAFFEQYASWGADLTLSGHTHGGLIRFPGIGSVISSDLTLFPEYDAGRFEEDGHVMLVSRGLGTHTFHIRINDRAQVLICDLYGS